MWPSWNQDTTDKTNHGRNGSGREMRSESERIGRCRYFWDAKPLKGYRKGVSFLWVEGRMWLVTGCQGEVGEVALLDLPSLLSRPCKEPLCVCQVFCQSPMNDLLWSFPWKLFTFWASKWNLKWNPDPPAIQGWGTRQETGTVLIPPCSAHSS